MGRREDVWSCSEVCIADVMLFGLFVSAFCYRRSRIPGVVLWMSGNRAGSDGMTCIFRDCGDRSCLGMGGGDWGIVACIVLDFVTFRKGGALVIVVQLHELQDGVGALAGYTDSGRVSGFWVGCTDNSTLLANGLRQVMMRP